MTLPIDETAPRIQDAPPSKVSRQGQGGGPKTAFGKEASSKNATTHGLSSRVPRNVPDSFRDDIDERMTFYVAQKQPQTDEDSSLCGLAALGFVQHREAVAEKQVYLKVRSYRAQVAWEADRISEAADLGARISKRPETVAADLGKSLHGALWLLDRWKFLLGCLDTAGKWNEEEVSMAYDLLGRDRMTRQADPERIAAGDLDVCRAIASKRIEHLEKHVIGPYTALDRVLRGMAVAGEHYLDDPTFRRLNRYENRALKLNRDCLAELERRRIARGLESYNPDGTIATPPPLDADPDDIEPDPDYRPVFYSPMTDDLPEPPPAPVPAPPAIAVPAPAPVTRPEPIASKPTTAAVSEPLPHPSPSGKRLTLDEIRAEIREARTRLEAERNHRQVRRRDERSAARRRNR
ncbi:MAG: hypothetical protein U0800_17255 [Isosphaeraceae bacterium]